MTSNMAHGPVSEAPAPAKNDVVEWTVRAHALLGSHPQCVAKSFEVCGISNKLDGSENALIHCAKELPAFTISYGNDNSDENIFNSDSDSDSNDEDEVDEEDDYTFTHNCSCVFLVLEYILLKTHYMYLVCCSILYFSR